LIVGSYLEYTLKSHYTVWCPYKLGLIKQVESSDACTKVGYQH